MFIDEVEITIKGGDGGNGAISFGKGRRSGPDGGNGGDGGDVYIVGSSDLTLLNQFSKKKLLDAEDGQPGGIKKMTGRDGEDLTIKLPVGTSIIDKRSGEEIVEIEQVDQKELICKGGEGGLGNFELRSSTNTTPMIAERGEPGETVQATVILKLIADYGLIGLPNAGKSSLLNEITSANVKTANYNFTTLSPNLGVLDGKILADIPGLIEGASKGRGLGISFLKHIEKVNILLHCVSSESSRPITDYNTIHKELGDYNKELLNKNEIILITKSDLVDHKKLKSLLKKFKNKSSQVLAVSIHDWDSLQELKKLLL